LFAICPATLYHHLKSMLKFLVLTKSSLTQNLKRIFCYLPPEGFQKKSN